jgi:ubiquinone/menaquinone biosynthesis C-methylase UbiE
MQSFYVCPKTKESMNEHTDGLLKADGTLYPFVRGSDDTKIPNFLTTQQQGEYEKLSLVMYDRKDSADIYRNFLDWLYKTFNENDTSFREKLISKLQIKKGNKVLITGCGLGDDFQPVLNGVGPTGEVHANDLAGKMVVSASHSFTKINNLFFSICDAQLLPFPNDFFDCAFHFGGINLFDDMKAAITDMDRVVKSGGRVVFGDESVAPWLKNTDYGRAAIHNNSLWGVNTPLNLLPEKALDVNLSWVLGNCFYLIDFEVSNAGPYMNMDVPHIGPRGGCMRTRYFGQLEGVSEESKKFIIEDAKEKGISIHKWLEKMIQEKQK